MIERRDPLLLIPGWALVAAFVGLGAAGAQELDPNRVRWSTLEFKAKKLGLSMRAEMNLEKITSAELEKVLIEPDDGPGLQPTGDSALLLAIHSSGLGQQADNDIWFDPSSGAVFQRTSTDPGRFRNYRFRASGGPHVLTRRPGDGEDDLPHERWTDVSEEDRRMQKSDRPPAEGSSLLYAVSAADLEQPGDRASLLVYSRDGLIEVDLEYDGTEKIKVDYEVESASGSRRVKGKRNLVRIAVSGRPYGDEEAELELLGLQGDISMYLDPEIRMLVQLSGKVKWVGTTHVRLQRAVLK